MLKNLQIIILATTLLTIAPAYCMEPPKPKGHKLFKHIKCGHVTALKNFLDYRQLIRQLNLAIKDNQGWQPIHHAVTRGDPAVINVLIAAGANVNAPIADANGHLPLDLAIQAGSQEIIQALTSAGAVAHPQIALEAHTRGNVVNTIALDGLAEDFEFLVLSGPDFLTVEHLDQAPRGELVSPSDSNQQQASSSPTQEELDQKFLNALLVNDLAQAQMLRNQGADINHRDVTTTSRFIMFVIMDCLVRLYGLLSTVQISMHAMELIINPFVLLHLGSMLILSDGLSKRVLISTRAMKINRPL